jgi:hypothetical protein
MYTKMGLFRVSITACAGSDIVFFFADETPGNNNVVVLRLKALNVVRGLSHLVLLCLARLE